MFDAVVDANVNRVSEGLRVVEEYVRFVRSHAIYTLKLAEIRKKVNRLFPQSTGCLVARRVDRDVRAKEAPNKRADIQDVLIANFKRVEEGLRVLEEYSGELACNALRYDVYELEAAILLLSKKPLIKKGVYLISDDVSRLKEGVRLGCSLVQLRDKSSSKEVVYNKAKAVSSFVADFDVPFIVNDFLDIAMLVDADGLHTGQDDLAVSDLISLWGRHKLYGRTTHSLAQGELAKSQGVDYVSVGPIWETPSKPGREGIGFDYLEAVKSLDIAYVAIGGIDDSNVSDIMAYSPFMIGVIRSFKSISDWQARFFS
ncbi:hypothetical protein CL658_05385 [bacterium]|nr:hypothetical protein [bacterium]|tara:strand:- start:2831 stop:3772 length:942 start_codon:yes stop_codon:yes gene_type:complete